MGIEGYNSSGTWLVCTVHLTLPFFGGRNVSGFLDYLLTKRCDSLIVHNMSTEIRHHCRLTFSLSNTLAHISNNT